MLQTGPYRREHLHLWLAWLKRTVCCAGALEQWGSGDVSGSTTATPVKGLAGVRCSPTTPSPQLPHQGQMPAWRQQLLHSDTVSADGAVPEVCAALSLQQAQH